jgi:copper homeostasis protein CutC
MAIAATKAIPCFVLVRPRAGDFCYDIRDVDLMRREIDFVWSMRLAGIGIGAGRALETAIQLGFIRVLTSGGAPDAVSGSAVIRGLVEQAAGRIDSVPEWAPARALPDFVSSPSEPPRGEPRSRTDKFCRTLNGKGKEA